MSNYTLNDLFYDTEYNNFVQETDYLVQRRRQQKKRSREWNKYRKAEIAAGRPDPGRNKYTPNRYYSRKRDTTTVVTAPVIEPVTVPPPPPSEIVLPDYPEIPANIMAELDKITIDMIDEILNEINTSGGDI